MNRSIHLPTLSVTIIGFISIFIIAAAFSQYSAAIENNLIKGQVKHTENSKGLAVATFAGGCFWCMEKPFEQIPGVVSVISGYIGGHTNNPTYKQVSAGTTGYAEAVQISYDPNKVSYRKLLDIFWHQIDPTDPDGSFVDRGSQYRSAIYYHNDKQKRLALQSKSELNRSGLYAKPIVTEITETSIFYRAEDYHQDYYKTNPLRYKFYRYRSGRDQYLAKVMAREKRIKADSMSDKDNIAKGIQVSTSFKKPTVVELKQRLNRLQYEVTQEDATERPFDNTYWDNHEAGIYVDIISGEPLFSSTDKYDSKTGWPSFAKPITKDALIKKQDRKLFSTRTEVRSRIADSHLGHVFNDGPAPTGLRYCINSASLRFIPSKDLKSKGYEELVNLFM